MGEIVNPICECGNCAWRGTVDDMKRVYPDIPDLAQRMEPGEPVPVGECPECGALCHPIDPAVKAAIDLADIGKREITSLRNTISRMVCMIEEIRTIQSPANTLLDVQTLGRAAIGNNPIPLKVVVEVLGGVAEVTTCPSGIECQIIDHDNAKAGI